MVTVHSKINKFVMRPVHPFFLLLFQERAAKQSMSKDGRDIIVITSRPYMTALGGSSVCTSNIGTISWKVLAWP